MQISLEPLTTQPQPQPQLQQHKQCKAHPEQRGQFYIANEPWNKFCSACALNRAICGYRIEKDLTPQEFQNKIILASLVQQLKLTIEHCQKQSNLHSTHIDHIKTTLLPNIDPILKSIQSHLTNLTALKNSIIDLYDNLINHKISKCHEIQSKYFMDSINFKNMLDGLETNYCDIIVGAKGTATAIGMGMGIATGEIKGDCQGFGKQVEVIKGEIQRNRRYVDEKFINEEYFAHVKAQFQTKFKQFQQKSAITLLPSTPPTLRRAQTTRQLTPKQQNTHFLLQQQKSSSKPLNSNSHINSIINLSDQNSINNPTSNPNPKAYFSHRKRSTMTSSIEDNKCPSSQLQFTPRPTNLTLKTAVPGSKRGCSIPLRAKNAKITEV